MLQHFRNLLPTIKAIEEIPTTDKAKPHKKQINIEKSMIKHKKKALPSLPIKLKMRPIKNDEYERIKPNSARNNSENNLMTQNMQIKKNNDDLENYTLKQRRRSLSFGFNLKETVRTQKKYPISAKNYQAPYNYEETLSDINENEEKIYDDHMFNNEVISIQNRLLKEKNQEISFLKDKLKSFQDISKKKLKFLLKFFFFLKYSL